MGSVANGWPPLDQDRVRILHMVALTSEDYQMWCILDVYRNGAHIRQTEKAPPATGGTHDSEFAQNVRNLDSPPFPELAY